MSIFSKIKDAIFGHKTATADSTLAPAGTDISAAPAPVDEDFGRCLAVQRACSSETKASAPP